MLSIERITSIALAMVAIQSLFANPSLWAWEDAPTAECPAMVDVINGSIEGDSGDIVNGQFVSRHLSTEIGAAVEAAIAECNTKLKDAKQQEESERGKNAVICLAKKDNDGRGACTFSGQDDKESCRLGSWLMEYCPGPHAPGMRCTGDGGIPNSNGCQPFRCGIQIDRSYATAWGSVDLKEACTPVVPPAGEE